MPTDILTAHSRVIVHPDAMVDLDEVTAAGTMAYAYISVGELGADASFRPEALALGLPTRGENTIWNSDLLDLRDGRWAEFLVDSVARAVVEKGYSAFFLDTLDSIELSATAEETEAQRVGLVHLIRRLRTTFPHHPIIVNRGFATLPQLEGMVDGLLVESVFAAYNFETDQYEATEADDTAQLLVEMEAAIALGLEIFVLDYADPDDPEAALAAANRILEAGYHAFVSTPELTGTFLGPWQPIAPSIQSQPLALNAIPGQSFSLSVRAVADPLPEYTWFRGNEMLESGPSSQLFIEAAEITDGGLYRVTVRNRFGEVSSSAVPVLVSSSFQEGRLKNLSVRAWSKPGDSGLIPGLVCGDGAVEVLVRGVGPGLADFDVPIPLADPRLTLVSEGRELASNDNWSEASNAQQVADAAARVGAFPLAAAGLDAATIFPVAGVVTLPLDGQGGEGEALVEVYELSETEGGLTNLSVRAELSQDSPVLVAGFVLGGEAAARVLVRAIGPGLAMYGVTEYLQNPLLEINRAGNVLAANESWEQEASWFEEKSRAVGAFPLSEGSLDAAIMLTLPPGVYSAVVRSRDADAGVVLAEVYLIP